MNFAKNPVRPIILNTLNVNKSLTYHLILTTTNHNHEPRLPDIQLRSVELFNVLWIDVFKLFAFNHMNKT